MGVSFIAAALRAEGGENGRDHAKPM